MKTNFIRFLPHIFAILGFVAVSLIYFYPVLQGKEIYQSDIVQYTGMAKEQNDFRAETGEEPYWTNSAFGGMPTYQLGAKYPHNYVKKLDSVLRFLPRPADYLFLYFIGFYVLLTVLRIDTLKAFFGALAFGFSTYLISIIGVGHNAKAHAIAYMPLVLAGVLLVFQKRYRIGGLLTTVAAALEIQANHFQMTYYLFILLLIIGVYYSIQFVKEKDFNRLWKTTAVFAVAGLLALGANASSLLATSEYAKFSTRSKTELTFNADNSPKTESNAMSYNYITEYSYGKVESFNLIAPRLFGGSNHEQLDEKSAMFDFLVLQGVPSYEAMEIIKSMPVYWGSQPYVAAPYYIGVVVFFFFVLAFFISENRKLKTALLIGVVLSLLLSWGKNFPILTNFFIDYVPMYNKFRAVASIQVILQLCVPTLAVLGFYEYFKIEDKKKQWDFLWKSGAVVLGILAILFMFKGAFDFSGMNDDYYSQVYGEEFMRALREDRASMYSGDILRSMGFVWVIFSILFGYVKNMLKPVTAVTLAGIVMTADLFFIDKSYVNSGGFVSKREVKEPFQATQADMQILQDTSHYRVFDTQGSTNSAKASYFFNSIGGYHAAKPRRMEQLFDYHINKNNVRVLNMLNVKYVLQTDEEGKSIALNNPSANGNAWFVKKVNYVGSADEEMKALDKLDTKNEAVVNAKEFGKALQNIFVKNSTAQIKLVEYKPNYLKYVSENTNNGLAIFSEIYYPSGWTALIDGKETDIYRANYTLRAIQVPAGKHKIEFKFEPQVVKTGSTISLLSSIAILLLIGAGLWVRYRKGDNIE